MRRLLICLIITLLVFNYGFVSATNLSDSTARGSVKFIENKNQWHQNIHYAAELSAGNLYLRKNSIQYFLYDRQAVSDLHWDTHDDGFDEAGNAKCEDELNIGMHQYIVNFVGSNPNPVISASKPYPEYYNYYLGKDTSRWAAGAKAFSAVYYEQMYAGIDMKMYSSGDNVKYDFIVRPTADIRDIKMRYDGVDNIYMHNNDLILETSRGVIQEKAPYAYQVVNGKRVPVQCNYQLACDELSFVFPNGYDENQPLIIDPLLIFSTYSGSNADNWGNTATPGEHGKLYSGGITNHFRGQDVNGNPLFLGEFPATEGAFQAQWGGIWDVAIIKYDSSGSNMEYATYLGGSGVEVPHSMIVDSDGNLIVMGVTSSSDFPVRNNAYQTSFGGGNDAVTTMGAGFIGGVDIFVVKLDKTGSQLFGSTFLGGDENDGINRTGGPLTRNYGDQHRGEVFVDDADNIYVSSVSESTGLFDDVSIAAVDRQFNGGQTDAIAVKLDKTLEKVIWGSYFGGTGDDSAFAIKINSSGETYVAGGTNSPDFTTTIGALHEGLQGQEDGWVVKVSADGAQLEGSTYLGTDAYDQVYFMDLDANDDLYVLGQTRGTYPISDGVYNVKGGGQFIHKLTPDLSTTFFSTTFGSVNRREPNLSLTAFLVSECDNMYVSGWGNSQGNFVSPNYMQLSTNGLPTTTDAFKTTTSGDDFYLMVLDAGAEELLYGTFFGGANALVHVDGGTSRFDKKGIVYHSVCASCDGSSSFPTTPNAWSIANRSGSGCNNAAFKFDLASLRARVLTNSIAFDNPGLKAVCFPDPVVFENKSIGGETFQWSFGDGTQVTQTDTTHVVHEYQQPGRYTVILTAVDHNTCIGVDIAKVQVDVFDNEFTLGDDGVICQGDGFTLLAAGGTDYTWYNADSSFFTHEQSPFVNPDDTTKYYVRIVERNKNCNYFDSLTVNVIPAVSVTLEAIRNYDCTDVPEIVFKNRTVNASSFSWEFGDGSTSTDENPDHDYDSGIYQLKLRATHEICSDEQTVTVNAQPLRTYNVITPTNMDGLNDYFYVQAPFPIHLKIFDRWGKEVLDANPYDNSWNAEKVGAGIYYYDISAEGDQVCKGWVHVLK